MEKRKAEIRDRWRMLIRQGIREGFTEEVIFDQRPKGGEGVNHADF